MFSVVHFSEMGEVEVVPSNWLNDDGQCRWPPYKSRKLKNAILQRENPSMDWEQFQIKILGVYDSYKKACRKCIRAEDTSNLETEASDDEKKNRKKRKKIIFSDSEEEINNCYLPLPSPIKNKVGYDGGSQSHSLLSSPICLQTSKFQNEKNCESQSQSLISTPISQQTTAFQNEQIYWKSNPVIKVVQSSPAQISSQPMSWTLSDNINVLQKPANNVCQSSSQDGPSNWKSSPVIKVVHSSPTQASSQPMSWTLSDSINVLQQPLNNVPESFSQDGPSSTEKRILKEIAEIRETLKQHTSYFNVLLHKDADPPSLGFILNLPVKSLEELKELENLLNDQSVFCKAVHHLGNRGGDEVKSVTRSILQGILSDEVACNFNWAGRGKKEEFKNLKLRNLVLQAARENVATKNASSKDVEDTIKLWLKSAPVRVQNKIHKMSK